MKKQNKAIVGSWMSQARLLQKHRELDEQLSTALLGRPLDQKRVAELKKQKLLCKDSLALQLAKIAVTKPSAEIIPFEGKPPTTTSLFLGTPRLMARGR